MRLFWGYGVVRMVPSNRKWAISSSLFRVSGMTGSWYITTLQFKRRGDRIAKPSLCLAVEACINQKPRNAQRYIRVKHMHSCYLRLQPQHVKKSALAPHHAANYGIPGARIARIIPEDVTNGGPQGLRLPQRRQSIIKPNYPGRYLV
jgi:hypothetical protein